MLELDPHLGATNPAPLAHYLFPDEQAEVSRMRAPNVRSFVKRAPQTLALARDLLALHPVPYNWAEEADDGWIRRQAGTRHVNPFATDRARQKRSRLVAAGAVWATEEAEGFEVFDTRGPLQSQRVAKSFLGRGTAVAVCDGWQRGERRYQGPGAVGLEVLRGGRVRLLRFDLDLPRGEAWPTRRHDGILDQLRLARSLAADMGLTMEAYTTGGRGVDVCLSLPSTATIRAASWISTAYSMLLDDALDGPLRYDTDSLHTPVRLPGQRHLGSGRLGLWIDLERGRFYGRKDQARLMSKGCCPSKAEGLFETGAFVRSLEIVEGRLEEMGCCVNRFVPMERFVETLDDAPTELAQRFLRTHPHAADAFWRKTARVRGRDERRGWSPRAVWDQNVEGGQTWEAMKGPHGLVAASVALFGDSAEEALLDRLSQIPASTPKAARQRDSTARSLLRTHRAAPRFAPLRLRDPREGEILAMEEVLARALRHTYLQDRVIVSLEIVLRAMIVLLADGRGECAVSGQRLADAIRRDWNLQMDTKIVERRLSNLCDVSVMGMDVLVAEKRNRRGTVLATGYRMGEELGRMLPCGDNQYKGATICSV